MNVPPPAASSPVYCTRHPDVEKRRNTQGNRICPTCHKEAKARHSAARRSRRNGVVPAPVDPVPVTPAPPATPRRGTFLAVAREYFEHTKDELRPATLKARGERFQHLAPLYDKQIAELTWHDVVDVLKQIRKRYGDTAFRCQGLAVKIMLFAKTQRYITTNPIPASELAGVVKKPPKVEHTAGITDPKRFGQLLVFIQSYDLTVRRTLPQVAAALRLAPHVFLRPGELQKLEWKWIDLDKAEITIPAAGRKNNKPLLVPLSHQALTILKQQYEHSGAGRYVFPGARGSVRPISENTLNVALSLFCSRDEHTAHGFRVSASTLINGELHYDSALVELQSGRGSNNKVASIYDRSERIPERREMLQKWSDYLDQLRLAAAAG